MKPSIFAALRDEASEDDPGFEWLSPQYSIQEILSYAKSPASAQIPAELQKHENIFAREVQEPEFMTFKPPQSEINSVAYINVGKQQRNVQIPQNPKRASSTQRVTQKDIKGRKQMTKHEEVKIEELEEREGPCWYYRDHMDTIMGPYSSKRMREWFNGRYFDSTLLIRPAGSDEAFKPIEVVFSDIAHAFWTTQGQKSNDIREKKLLTLASFSQEEDGEDSWENHEK